ncbi:unnamed protein product, partial [Schistosoma mattheei]
GIECRGRAELNETQKLCTTKKFLINQLNRISRDTVLDMIHSNDTHIFDEVLCKSEENISSGCNYDQRPDAVLINADFSSYPSLCKDVLKTFEKNISEESNFDVISDIIYSHNALAL